MADLKGRSVRGGAVTLTAQAVKFVLQTGSTMVLARLLTPQDFGLVAMVTAVTGFVAMFKDAGLSMATVQRDRITHAQVSTLFWINVGLSIAVMLVVAALAPGIAWFYGEPRLVGITLVLAGTFVFGGLTVQHQALLRRQMRFRALASIEIASRATGIVTAIAMGLAGCGYWSLVGMTAGSAVVNCVLVWLASGWCPGRPVRGSGVRSMLAFGGNLTAASALSHFGDNLDNVLIGWWWGSASLGLYSKACGLLELPLQQVNAPLAAVAVPALSRSICDPDKYRRSYLKALEQLALITGPPVAFMIVYADHVIGLVLGPQWTGAANLFSILGFAGILLPIWNSTGWLFVSQARMSDHLRFHVIDSIFEVCSILIGLPWGVTGVAVGVGIRYYLVIPILFWIVGRKGPVQTADFYRVLLFPVMVTMTCLVTLSILRFAAGPITPILSVISGIALVAVIVSGMCVLTAQGKRIGWSLLDVLQHLKPR